MAKSKKQIVPVKKKNKLKSLPNKPIRMGKNAYFLGNSTT